MFCPNCGADLADGAKFCPKCGAQLNDIEGRDVDDIADSAGINRQTAQSAADQTAGGTGGGART